MVRRSTARKPIHRKPMHRKPKHRMGTLAKVGAALAAPFPDVELALASMANPDSGIKFVLGIAKKAGKRASEVQSVIFDKLKWTADTAKGWLKDHGFTPSGKDEGATFWRFRQQSPRKYKEFRTIVPGTRNPLRFGDRPYDLSQGATGRYHVVDEKGYIRWKSSLGIKAYDYAGTLSDREPGLFQVIDTRDGSVYGSYRGGQPVEGNPKRNPNGLIRVTASEVSDFKHSYPASGLPNDHDFYFEFASNGDLVDLWAQPGGTKMTPIGRNHKGTERWDGPALVALSQDAQEGKRGARVNPAEAWPKVYKTKKAAKAAWYDSAPGRNDRAKFVKVRGGYQIVPEGHFGGYGHYGTTVDDMERGDSGFNTESNPAEKYVYQVGPSGRWEFFLTLYPMDHPAWNEGHSREWRQYHELAKNHPEKWNVSWVPPGFRNPDVDVAEAITSYDEHLGMTTRPEFQEATPDEQAAAMTAMDLAENPNIPTPVELQPPFSPARVRDFGLTLVHQLGGEPRNYLHEVGVRDADADAIQYLSDAGYSRDYGWKDRELAQWWAYRKQYPLSVAKWVEENPQATYKWEWFPLSGGWQYGIRNVNLDVVHATPLWVVGAMMPNGNILSDNATQEGRTSALLDAQEWAEKRQAEFSRRRHNPGNSYHGWSVQEESPISGWHTVSNWITHEGADRQAKLLSEETGKTHRVMHKDSGRVYQTFKGVRRENPERNGFADPTPSGWGRTTGRAHAGDRISGNLPGTNLESSPGRLTDVARELFDANKATWGFKDSDFTSFAVAFQKGYQDRLAQYRRKGNPGDLGQQAFDAAKEFRLSGAYYETGVANARVAKYGFNKWFNNLDPQEFTAWRNRKGHTKNNLAKAWLMGWAAGKRVEKKGNPESMERELARIEAAQPEVAAMARYLESRGFRGQVGGGGSILYYDHPVSSSIGNVAIMDDGNFNIHYGSGKFHKVSMGHGLAELETAVVAGKFKHLRRENPESAAAQLYEDFHGKPPGEVKEIITEVHDHEWLVQLGTLVELKVATVTKLDATISFAKDADAPDLCSSEDGRQLYIEGGDQAIDLGALKMSGEKWLKESMVLGVLYELTYQTQKGFHKFRTTDYYHRLAEDGGPTQPTLLYDPNNKLLSVSGGNYQVKDIGIVN